MRLKSHLPPVSFQSVVTGRHWIVTTGKDSSGWIEVDRSYGWAEIESMWDRIEYGMPKTWENKVEVKKEYKVKGSKDNVYNVVNDDGFWTCSCPAHGFSRGRDCKHIIQIKNKK